MDEPSGADPAPTLQERLLATTAVALVLTALHAWFACWDLGFLGRKLSAPVALFAYQALAVLPLAWIYALLKSRGEGYETELTPLAVATVEPLRLGLFASFFLGLGLQVALLAPEDGAGLLRMGLMTGVALVGWVAAGLGLDALGRRVRSRQQLVLGCAALLATIFVLGLGSGGLARASGTPAEESALTAAARAADVAPATSLSLAAPSGRRVLVIGIDGGDPRELLPLVEAGELPTFARLIEQGTLLPLEAENYSLGSPVLWTNMVTGSGHHEHGIDCLLTIRAPGLPLLKVRPDAVRPVSNPSLSTLGLYLTANAVEAGPPPSHTRKVPALWNQVSEHGGSVRMIGWPATWPAEAVRGELLTARTRRTSWEVFHPFRPNQPGLSYPPGLFAELSGAVGAQQGPNWDDLDALAEWTDDDRARLADWSNTIFARDELSFLALALTGDRWNTEALKHLLRAQGPRDLTLFAYYSVDLSGHYFWDAAHPDEFDPRPGPERMRLAGVIPGVWKHLDRWIGEILSAVDEQTMVLIVSDHGMQKASFLDFKAHHAEEALLLAYGPGVAAKGVQEDTGATSKDVAPTVLKALGWPIPERFAGRVLTEVFAE